MARFNGDSQTLPFLSIRLHELRNAVEAVSLLLHTPHLLPPPSSTHLTTLAEVLIGCFQAACQATVALSFLPTKKKEVGVAGASGDTEKSKEGESRFDAVIVCGSRRLARYKSLKVSQVA